MCLPYLKFSDPLPKTTYFFVWPKSKCRLSLIRFFPFCMKKAWVLNYQLGTLQRLWSDWADAQADLSLCFVNTHFVRYVMSLLVCTCMRTLKTLVPPQKSHLIRVLNFTLYYLDSTFLHITLRPYITLTCIGSDMAGYTFSFSINWPDTCRV